MTDFKLSKKIMYSTPFDCRQVLSVFERSVIDDDDDDEITIIQKIRDQKIEQYIYGADSTITASLAPTYGASSLINETPYFIGYF